MTTEIPAPQIPQVLYPAMSDWGRHHTRLRQIDAEAERLGAQITDMQRQIADLGQRHADLGRIRHDAERDEGIARGMAEAGCQLAGIEMPPAPPAIPAPPVLPSNVAPIAPGDPLTPATPYPPVADAAHALGQAVAGHATSETITDPRPVDAGPQDGTGGDQPESGFQPDTADTRRRRGGRRAQ